MPSPPSPGGSYPDNGGYYRNYTNAIFINKTILIPLYRPEVDAPALAQWQEMMPGYNIVGIDVDNAGENLISLVGAIHCITHTIGVEDPLWIVHQPIAQADSASTVTLDAMIKHNTGISNATVFWRPAGEVDYTEIAMSFNTGTTWTADMTLPGANTDIEYYIEATANSGKTLTRPIVAPDGYWTINVDVLGTQDFDQAFIAGPHPNPADNKVHFNLERISGNLNITVFNLLGQQLNSFTHDTGKTQRLELSIEQYPAGLLFVRIEGSFGEVIKKIVRK